MDFVSLDLETATPSPDSPCELGLAIVRGGVVREVRNWLIKPRQWPWFSPWNIAVHGIRPDDVADAAGWREVWEEASPLIEGGIVVAHNAAFDMGVIRATLASHGMRHTPFRYFCSVSMARRVWPGMRSYGLSAMCDHHRIPLKHHRAGNDAEAAAELVLRAVVQRRSTDMTAWLGASGVKLGTFTHEAHRTPGGKLYPAAV